MSEVRITLEIEVDGTVLPNHPIIRRYSTNEVESIGNYTVAANNDTTTFNGLPMATMPALNIALIQTDQALNININQLTKFALNANGYILLVGVNLAQATATNNITINNPAAATAANVTGLVAGT